MGNTMPQMEWDETDVLTCLKVLPEVEEFGTSYHYETRQEELTLSVRIWPHESIVAVSLSHQEATCASWTLAVRGFVRRVCDNAGERLEFCDCMIVSSRFAYMSEANPFGVAPFRHSPTMQLFIKPHIRIAFV